MDAMWNPDWCHFHTNSAGSFCYRTESNCTSRNALVVFRNRILDRRWNCGCWSYWRCMHLANIPHRMWHRLWVVWKHRLRLLNLLMRQKTNKKNNFTVITLTHWKMMNSTWCVERKKNRNTRKKKIHEPRLIECLATNSCVSHRPNLYALINNNNK